MFMNVSKPKDFLDLLPLDTEVNTKILFNELKLTICKRILRIINRCLEFKLF